MICIGRASLDWMSCSLAKVLMRRKIRTPRLWILCRLGPPRAAFRRPPAISYHTHIFGGCVCRVVKTAPLLRTDIREQGGSSSSSTKTISRTRSTQLQRERESQKILLVKTLISSDWGLVRWRIIFRVRCIWPSCNRVWFVQDSRVTAALSRAERKTRVCVSLSKAKRVKSQQAAARRRRSSRGQHAPRQGQQHDKKIVTLFEFQTRCAGSSPNLNSPKRIGLFFKTD